LSANPHRKKERPSLSIQRKKRKKFSKHRIRSGDSDRVSRKRAEKGKKKKKGRQGAGYEVVGAFDSVGERLSQAQVRTLRRRKVRTRFLKKGGKGRGARINCSSLASLHERGVLPSQSYKDETREWAEQHEKEGGKKKPIFDPVPLVPVRKRDSLPFLPGMEKFNRATTGTVRSQQAIK